MFVIRGYRGWSGERIADPVILSLIGKWLKAGAMQDGSLFVPRRELRKADRSPVCSPTSICTTPWTCGSRRSSKPQCQGEAYLVRFVDDFVLSFQYLADAENFQRQLRARLARFNLELAEEKLGCCSLADSPPSDCARVDRRPETFEFLGFKHVCGTDRDGRFALIRLPQRQELSQVPCSHP